MGSSTMCDHPLPCPAADDPVNRRWVDFQLASNRALYLPGQNVAGMTTMQSRHAQTLRSMILRVFWHIIGGLRLPR